MPDWETAISILLLVGFIVKKAIGLLVYFMKIYVLLYKHTFMLLTLHAGPFPACSLVMK